MLFAGFYSQEEQASQDLPKGYESVYLSFYIIDL